LSGAVARPRRRMKGFFVVAMVRYSHRQNNPVLFLNIMFNAQSENRGNDGAISPIFVRWNHYMQEILTVEFFISYTTING
jgi:hypothetical protein